MRVKLVGLPERIFGGMRCRKDIIITRVADDHNSLRFKPSSRIPVVFVLPIDSNMAGEYRNECFLSHQNSVLQTYAGNPLNPCNDGKCPAGNIFCRTYHYSGYRQVIVEIKHHFNGIYNGRNPA